MCFVCSLLHVSLNVYIRFQLCPLFIVCVCLLYHVIASPVPHSIAVAGIPSVTRGHRLVTCIIAAVAGAMCTLPASVLGLTAQWLARADGECVISSIQEPVRQAYEEGTADNVAQGHGDDGLVDEFARAEVGAVEHADGHEVEVGDGMLVAERDAVERC